MATFKYYGVIAVKFSGNSKHPHHISHVFIIEVTDGGYGNPGKIYKRVDAVAMAKTSSMYTMDWNYNTGNWNKGAEVDTEAKDGVTYLRSKRNNTVTDNLANLIDYDYFGKV